MEITYREFKTQDQPIVTKLIKSLYREDPEGLPISANKISRTFTQLKNHADQGTILVIRADKQIIGYAILINFWSNEYGGNILHIDEMYVNADFRGQGIGTKFLQYLINARYNKCIALELETTTANHRARELYEKIGFKISDNDHLVYEIN